MGNTAKKDSKAVEKSTRAEQALQLRIGRMSYTAIAHKLGVSRSTIVSDVRSAIAELREKTLEKAAELRALDSEAIDVAQNAIWSQVTAGDRDAIEMLVKLQARRSKLWGLDAPVQTINVDQELAMALKKLEEALSPQAYEQALAAIAGDFKSP